MGRLPCPWLRSKGAPPSNNCSSVGVLTSSQETFITEIFLTGRLGHPLRALEELGGRHHGEALILGVGS